MAEPAARDGQAPPADDPPAGGVAGAWLRYTLLRLVLFLGTAAALFLVSGLNGFPLLLVALLVSSIASLFVLQRQRDALVAAQEAKGLRRRAEKQRQRERLQQEPGA